MDEKDKREYLERYQAAKQKGAPFFPDILFKDAVAALVVFVILAALAYFAGAPLEARADPSDSNYTPRPEWYFLFLFQLLKYFPGNLEVIGVIVLPTLAVLALLALPFLDRGPRRNFRARKIVIGATALVVLGVLALTVLAAREAPPPASAASGDPIAALYAQNCASCHGPSLRAPDGTDLHAVIAQGRHEGMPAWSADLSTDQIDALAGYIASPGGSQLFTNNCSVCHPATELVGADPQRLRRSIEQGPNFPGHGGMGIPNWGETLSASQRTAILNFLIAPDGQRLFAVYCSSCHGQAVAFSGEEPELRALISQGGLHLEMPPWRGVLSQAELEALSEYVVDPSAFAGGQALFEQNCASCHGQRIPAAADVEAAMRIIAGGGAHTTMPVWGEVLTQEQLDALVGYTLQAARGAPTEVGQRLFSQNCAACHGDFGEGGANPARPGDIIAPISSREYLATRDDQTLRSIIAMGQPDFGMSPFSTAFGGPLEDDEIDAILAFLRTWEASPPVEAPAEILPGPVPLSGAEIFAQICSRCHGPNGEGGLGPVLRGPEFQARYNAQTLYDVISLGHEATPMIAWGEILTGDQIRQLVDFLRRLGAGTSPAPATAVSFSADIVPILETYCFACHGSLGGWDASSYLAVMASGDHAPVVIPGDGAGSLLGQKLLGTQTFGTVMPPGGSLSPELIQVILDWMDAGAPDN